MEQTVERLLEHLDANPVLQGLLAGACTFILEDPTTLTCGLLVADGRMLYMTAVIGLCAGICLGDYWLYGMGRLLGPRIVHWGWVSQGRLDRTARWFEKNMFTAVFVSRFVPGLRLPANLAAGISHASPWVYMPYALLASIIWTVVAVTLVSRLGQAVLPLLGTAKWPVAISLIVIMVYIQRRSIKKMAEDPGSTTSEEAPASFFEFWHPVLFYIPVGAYYAGLALRYLSVTLPTAANPSIYSGGLIRESKSEILRSVGASERRWLLPHVNFKRRADMEPAALAEEALAALDAEGIALPIVAKPDQGQRGLGVRPVRTREELADYLAHFPEGRDICLQKLAAYREEAGLLYYRFPGDATGRITSITLKEFPEVTGDGTRTIRELIELHPRARYTKEVFFNRHGETLERVLESGEIFSLVFAGNHKQGCVFYDGIHILTDAMVHRIDEIARAIPEFYFGRFDVRFRDTESFQRGEDFEIVEINGAGAEATHIWDPNARLWDAYSTLFEQWRVLFRIGAANRARGVKPIGPIRVLRDVAAYHRIARKYPQAF